MHLLDLLGEFTKHPINIDLSCNFLMQSHLDDGIATPTVGKIVAVQAAGGIIAGATASCITTPLDTIKTRLQVIQSVILYLAVNSLFWWMIIGDAMCIFAFAYFG